MRSSCAALVSDQQGRVLVTELAGASISVLHWLWRYRFILHEDGGELPISKLGGSTAVIDSTCSVMLAFAEAPLLTSASANFASTARLLVGILISDTAVARAAFSASCCGVLLEGEDNAKRGGKASDRCLYSFALHCAAACWIFQSAFLGVIMADLLATPAAHAMSRSIVGAQLPSRLLLFAALVCTGIPRLNSTLVELAKTAR